MLCQLQILLPAGEVKQNDEEGFTLLLCTSKRILEQTHHFLPTYAAVNI